MRAALTRAGFLSLVKGRIAPQKVLSFPPFMVEICVSRKRKRKLF